MVPEVAAVVVSGICPSPDIARRLGCLSVYAYCL